MEYSEQYLTYEDYRSLGGTLDLASFYLLEFEARRKIDIRTQNRLKNVDVIPYEVKICEYNIMNIVSKYNDDKKRNISSESVGSWSVSYNTDFKKLIDDKSHEINDIITNSLMGIVVNNEHLLFLGCK